MASHTPTDRVSASKLTDQSADDLVRYLDASWVNDAGLETFMHLLRERQPFLKEAPQVTLIPAAFSASLLQS